MSTTTIQDDYGDKLVIDVGVDGQIILDAYEDDSAVSLHFDTNADAFRSVIRTLFSAKTATPPDGTAVVKASDVSFNEGLLRLAVVHEKTVEFSYAKGTGSIIETRRLKPSAVQEAHGHLIFVGYDPDREGPRAYRVDRMKGEVRVLA